MWSSVWITKGRFWFAALLLLLLPCFSRVSAAFVISTNYVTVPVKEVAFDDILSAQRVEEVDALLYPSGLELPTKYIDFYMFADPGLESIVISEKAYELLLDNYPVTGSTYTWAEYYSAQLYVSWLDTLYGGAREGTQADDIEALSMLVEKSGIDLSHCTTQTKLTDVSLLQEYLRDFSEALVDPTSENYAALKTYDIEGGVSLTMGYDYLWDCTNYEAPIGLDLQNRIRWYNTRLEYMNLLGIVFDSSSGIVPVEYSQVEEVSKNDYVGALDVVYTSKDISSGYRGFRDYILSVSLIVVVVGVVVSAVRDFFQKRRDPLSHWRKYL